jgi:hypothetical protein
MDQADRQMVKGNDFSYRFRKQRKDVVNVQSGADNAPDFSDHHRLLGQPPGFFLAFSVGLFRLLPRLQELGIGHGPGNLVGDISGQAKIIHLISVYFSGQEM